MTQQLVEIFPLLRQDQPILHGQQDGCWCLSNARSHGIIYNDTDHVELEELCAHTSSVNERQLKCSSRSSRTIMRYLIKILDSCTGSRNIMRYLTKILWHLNMSCISPTEVNSWYYLLGIHKTMLGSNSFAFRYILKYFLNESISFKEKKYAKQIFYWQGSILSMCLLLNKISYIILTCFLSGLSLCAEYFKG